MRFSITHFDEVDSTNHRIKDLIAQGAAEGEVVIARSQTGGYGRRGNSWSSPEGGLYMSVLLRPSTHDLSNAHHLATVSLAVGIAVRYALGSLLTPDAAKRVKLKWPNDIVVAREEGYEKLVGISLEGNADALCVGIGVNVTVAKKGFACMDSLEQPGQNATVLQIAEAVLESLDKTYVRWLSAGFAPFCREYRQQNIMEERVISAQVRGEVVEGSFQGVDETGALLLRLADGSSVRVNSGEAHIIGIV